MNTPYVKEFDKNGTLTNPIKGVLRPKGPNRRQRRYNPKDQLGLVVYNKGGGKDLATRQFILTYQKLKTTINPEEVLKTISDRTKRIKGIPKYRVIEMRTKKGMLMRDKNGSTRYIVEELIEIKKVKHLMPADLYTRKVQAENNKEQ